MWDQIQDTLMKAGLAALVAFVSYIFQSFGLPAPEPPDLNIVGADPAMAVEVSRVAASAAAEASAKTAISIPMVLFFIDLAFKLFGGKFSPRK